MSLNPVQFGKDVIDQYGRYLRTTFPITDPRLAEQFRRGLAYGPGGGERLAKGPYVSLNRPFVQGPGIEELIADDALGLHPALGGLFPFETLHRHQELSLRSVVAGRHVMLATGTGSGKTEGFLLPILDHCLKLRDANAPEGVAALLVYPMNALVNDQMDRLRPLLAGSRLTFGRYTGETPETASGVHQLSEPRHYTDTERHRARERVEALPLPWEECASRADIRERTPRLLLTNYSQLEYMLLRDRDLDLLRSPMLRFFVFDEVHTYTGAVGSEVACLIRRLRAVADKSGDDVVCIGTSATVSDRDGGAAVEQATRAFGSRLFGVAEERLDLITEQFRELELAPADRYAPEPPPEPQRLLAEVLDEVRDLLVADEVEAVSDRVLELAAQLCGRPAPAGGGSLERLHALLAPNRVVERLQLALVQPTTLDEILPQLTALGPRRDIPREGLEAEALCYLLLGALARSDDEPLLRPKLHYFLQGLHGLWLSWGDDGPEPDPNLHFSEPDPDGGRALPMSICRACGQHYLRVAAGEARAVDGGQAVAGVQEVRSLPGLRDQPGDGEVEVYLTDRLVNREGEEAEDAPTGAMYLCRRCGSIHDGPGESCLNPRCRAHNHLLPLLAHPGPLGRCLACGAPSGERSPIVTAVHSQEAYDVMVLAQTALASMPAPELRRVLIFADSRQEAAFQAGWMESRSLRFRVRHIAYQVLEHEPDRRWYFTNFLDAVVEQGVREGLVPARGASRQDMRDRLTWLLVEEFFAASERQRRNSLERLGLARVVYEGLESAPFRHLAERWSSDLGVSPDGVIDLVSLILDQLRLRRAVNHPWLRRVWNDWDKEVRDGLVTVAEHFRPQVVVRQPAAAARRQSFTLPYRSASERSAVEHLVKKSCRASSPDTVGAFLDDLWDLLVQQDFLVPSRIMVWRQGRLQPVTSGGVGHQVNLDLVQLQPADDRFVCQHCLTSRSLTTPNGACPGYNCHGRLERSPRDEDHFDVVQYTRLRFVPLLSREHSAQVPHDDRLDAEREFKRANGKVNCLVATPTLEMGVDIGPLEIVAMRNVPPSPANYAQRSGRAGRRHRIGAIFAYCRGTQHDQFFYADPPAMISGQVRVPAFTMRNEPLVRKHVHSASLTALRSIDDGGRDAVLQRAFPTFIWPYFGARGDDGSQRLVLTPPVFDDLRDLVNRHEEDLLEVLQRTFAAQWPGEDADVVAADTLRTMLRELPSRLEETVGRLVAEIAAYKRIQDEYRNRQTAGEILAPDDQKRLDSYGHAISRFWGENQANYALSFLAEAGFFPGYALVRDSVRATCPQPPLAVNRNLAVALRELTPANLIYANRQTFKVRRLDLYRMQAQRPDFSAAQLEKTMVFDPGRHRVGQVTSQPVEGGENPGRSFTSLQMIDVELEGTGRITDQQEYRFLVGFDTVPLLLEEHAGGHGGAVAGVPYRWLRSAGLRLVNLAPRGRIPASPYAGSGFPHIGFPICPVCGETRSPFASTTEIENFVTRHTERCGRSPDWFALHVDLTSDMLFLGPLPEEHSVVNVMEAVRIGARNVLEMGDQELEVEVVTDGDGREVGVMYDPFPGGSGLLPLVMDHWARIVEEGRRAMDACSCPRACYSCLLTFRNQQHHGVLDRHRASNALLECSGDFHREYDIPANFVPSPPPTGKQDSSAEELFLTVLAERSFPQPPEAQYRLELGGGAVTVADFAYPTEKVLIFIDGLSARIHGNPTQQAKDRLLRTKARIAGWRVCEFSAQGLADATLLAGYLEELGLLLATD
jgi:hypothetical protein